MNFCGTLSSRTTFSSGNVFFLDLCSCAVSAIRRVRDDFLGEAGTHPEQVFCALIIVRETRP